MQVIYNIFRILHYTKKYKAIIKFSGLNIVF